MVMGFKNVIEELEGYVRQVGEIAAHLGGAILYAQLGQYGKAVDKLVEVVAECREIFDDLEDLATKLKETLRD